MPLHRGRQGLLAWREAWSEAVLAQRLESFTDRTLTGPVFLRGELRRTVARGYAVEDREYEPDSRALAAPVFPADGEAVAALAVAAPAARLPAERQREIAEAVRVAAAALSAEFDRRTEGAP